MVRHTQRRKSGKRTMKNLMSRMKWGGKRHHKRGGSGSPSDMDVNTSSPFVPMDSEKQQYGPPMMTNNVVGGKHRKGHKSRRSRKMKGGDGGAEWVTKNFGNGQQQWDNTFGPGSLTQSGNLLPTVTGAPGVLPNNIPQGSLANASNYAQAGGKRRRKKGGSFMSMVSNALVPLTLWGMQNKFTRRHKKH